MRKKVKLEKIKRRFRRKLSIRGKISGTAAVPRLSVFRSNKNLAIQAIDDANSKTLCSISTYQKEITSKKCDKEAAKELGEKLGEKLLELKIKKAVFDRNGYFYHGKIAAIADGIRSKKIQL
ncbi:MAG: 50S ribosomal protein L18 [Spirochaetes bacterium]|nr:50S ribosomal protein L18 [Spirochaetota bacterium]